MGADRSDRVIVGADFAWVLAGPAPGDPAVRLWAARRMSFESEQSREQRALVVLVAPQIRALEADEGDRLHGRFVSSDRRGRQPDAENVTFYNWRRGDGHGTPFVVAPHALSFERSYSPSPPCPHAPSATLPYFTEWSIRQQGADDGSWERGDQLASWTAACPIVAGDEAGRYVWRAIGADRSLVTVEHAGAFDGLFGLDIHVSLPPGATFRAAEAVKGCVDGVIASFQRFPEPLTDAARAVVRKHAGWAQWRPPLTETEFEALVTREPEKRLFDGAPFNGNGLDPCDDRCVCGTVTATSNAVAERPTIAGRIYAVGERG
jgi:hypothetical protein